VAVIFAVMAEAVLDDRKRLGEILARSHAKYEAWRDSGMGPMANLVERVSALYPPLSHVGILKKWFGEKKGLVFSLLEECPGVHLHLAPPSDQAVLPVLVFKYDYRENPGAASFRLKLFSSDGPGLRSCGFRFETAERRGSPRPLAHVQGITVFQKDSRQAERSGAYKRSWLPETSPSFPLPASSPSGVAAWMLQSLYGLDTLQQEFQRDLRQVFWEEQLRGFRNGLGFPGG
jgi:hypothetical protein